MPGMPKLIEHLITHRIDTIITKRIRAKAVKWYHEHEGPLAESVQMAIVSDEMETMTTERIQSITADRIQVLVDEKHVSDTITEQLIKTGCERADAMIYEKILALHPQLVSTIDETIDAVFDASKHQCKWSTN